MKTNSIEINALLTKDVHKIKESNPVGRPKKDQKEVRNKHIMINMTEEEDTLLTKLADERGLSKASLVRVILREYLSTL